ACGGGLGQGARRLEHASATVAREALERAFARERCLQRAGEASQGVKALRGTIRRGPLA
ncbi:unnamed protein product, partial [Pylaiella littoralis]